MGEPKKVALNKGKEQKVSGKKNSPKAGRLDKVKRFLRGVKSEFKKVNWPGRRQLVVYTGVTFFAVALVALIIWIFDLVLGWVLQFII